ncbi:MAG: type II toxin-antitoxin system YafQ family toxin [Chloroflexi bacterium]|nr:type II toxin-antitoxin system YafQ family toxin [Chloroflexota bacterium]
MDLVPTSAFRRRLKRLTDDQRRRVAAALKRFQTNPFDPSLETHKLSGDLAGHWAFKAGYDLRVVVRIEGVTAYLLAVGSHDEVY